MQRSTRKTSRTLLAAFSAALLVLSACSGSAEDLPEDSPAPASNTTQEPEQPDSRTNGDDSEEEPELLSEPDGEEPDEASGSDTAADGSDEANQVPLPTKIIDAGKVAPGTSQSASGKKDALVVFTQSNPFAVVADFECKECKGDIEIQQLGSHDVLDVGSKSLAGSYLLDIIGSVEEEQTLIVRANGEWDIKLQSWDDLPISSGTQQGKGADVLYIGDEASGIEVEYKPPKGGGKLSVTATSAVEKEGETPKVVSISGGKKFTKKKDIKLPGVVTISGKGSWTIKLVP